MKVQCFVIVWLGNDLLIGGKVAWPIRKCAFAWRRTILRRRSISHRRSGRFPSFSCVLTGNDEMSSRNKWTFAFLKAFLQMFAQILFQSDSCFILSAKVFRHWSSLTLVVLSVWSHLTAHKFGCFMSRWAHIFLEEAIGITMDQLILNLFASFIGMEVLFKLWCHLCIQI